MQISRLTAKDTKAVYDIEKDSIDCPWSLSQIEREIDNPFFVVLKDDEKVLGYGGFYQVADEGDINNIAILRSERGKGYSKLIIETLISFALKNNLKALTLEVSDKNIVALNLYKKYGFIIKGERKSYYPDGSNALIMWKYFD